MVAHSPGSERSGFKSRRSKYFLRFNGPSLCEIHEEEFRALISSHVSSNEEEANSELVSTVTAGRERAKIMSWRSPSSLSGGHPRRSLTGPAASNSRTIAFSDLT
ncbi:hypothetical protein J6590_086303 [Homalodisca vitripennis]|nr:hypothetical protein J6590_086303 [Homalodisca vitripennis]